jgi:hypothetical protein
MRTLFALSALLVVAAAGPTMARDYTPTMTHDYQWCARTVTNDSGDCSFTYYQQCMATVSGQGGDCIQNPRLAYDQSRRWNRAGPQYYNR